MVTKVTAPSIAPKATPAIAMLPRIWRPQAKDSVVVDGQEFTIGIFNRPTFNDGIGMIIECRVEVDEGQTPSPEDAYEFCVNTVDLRAYLRAEKHIRNRVDGLTCDAGHDHRKVELQSAHFVGGFQGAKVKYAWHTYTSNNVYVAFRVDVPRAPHDRLVGNRVKITLRNSDSNIVVVRHAYVDDQTVMDSTAD